MEDIELESATRLYEVNTKPPSGVRLSIGECVLLSYRLLSFYQRKLYQLGLLLTKHQALVLVASIILVALSCTGYMRMHEADLSADQFVLQEIQSRKDLDNAATYYPLLKARQQVIILRPKDDGSILKQECLEDAASIHNVVLKTPGYQNMCAKQSTNLRNKSYSGCVFLNPLELVSFQVFHFKDLPKIIADEMKTPTQLLSNGRTLRFSVKQMLGDFRYEKGKKRVSASALRLVYFVTSPDTTDERQKTLGMEKVLASRLASQDSQLRCSSMTFMVAQTTDRVEMELLKPGKWAFAGCAAVLFFCGVLFTLLMGFSNWFVVALLGISCVGLGLVCSAGILLLAGLPLSPTFWFQPFLMLGNGFTLVLLASRELESRSLNSGDDRKFGDCLASFGPFLVATAVTDLLLFSIAIWSSYRAISNFFIFDVVAGLFISFLTLTFILVLNLYMKNKKPTKRLSFYDSRRITDGFWNKVTEAFGKVVTSWFGKTLALFLVVGVLVISSFCVIQSAQWFDTDVSPGTDLNMKGFEEARRQFYDEEVDVSLVVRYDDIDYSSATVQRQMLQLTQSIDQAPYSAGPSLSWIAALVSWANKTGISSSGKSFYPTLLKFLNVTENFKEDIIFKDTDSSIASSRLHFFMRKTAKFSANYKAMKKLQEDLKNVEDVPLTAVSSWFTHLEEQETFKQESLLIFGITAAVVFVCTIIFTANPRVSFVLASIFALHLFEVTGMMHVMDVPINQLIFPTIFTGIVMSLNSNIYVAQRFVMSSQTSGRDAMINSLASCGPPVLFGGILSTLGSVGLGFTFTHFVDTFHFVLPLLFVVGMVHTFAILAPLLALQFRDRRVVTTVAWLVSERRSNYDVEHSLPSAFVAEHTAKQPSVSIIGMSCRFPRANSKSEFWSMLVSGIGVVSEDFPSNRPEQHQEFHCHYHPKQFVSGRLVALGGAYMESIRGFDSSFFGISDQEARAMDPQQRIQLQVVYEAIEDAGLRLEDLQRCRTGIFLGYMNTDHATLVSRRNNIKNLDQFASTGTSASILANRISFCLNLTGPSLSVNTACSSSLTALQLACDSLHKGRCEVAVVCAPNLILDYKMQVITGMAGLLAPDGHCKSFDASGDGYGRGEGFAAVALKLTDAAVGDKDDIYCEVVACGMNSDGQNAVPITAPSMKMQAALMHAVLEESGVGPRDVDYFEAHGTGTAIGDVVETNAIAEVYCPTSSLKESRTLKIGSVKSNLNHTESTSGLAGLMKVALMIKHEMYVPTINIHTLNPRLKLKEKHIAVQQTHEDWKQRNQKPRIAAINSFGFGGSNVHAILREPSRQTFTPPVKHTKPREVNVMTLSAKSKHALQDMATAHAQWLEGNVENDSLMSDLCYTLNERRTQHPHRLALTFRNFEEASRAVVSFAEEKTGWEDLVSYAESERMGNKIVFMFGGQGSQWYAMGRQLIANEPTFREALIRVGNLIKNFGEEWSLLEVLSATEAESRIVENRIAQPATFAIQYATAELLKSLGIFPSAVLGHSLGEFAAACTSGAITVEEALRWVLIRSSLQEKTPRNGAMAALGMSEENTKNLLSDLQLEKTLDVAAVNDASSVTISGDAESVECLGNYIGANHADVFWRVLGTSRAFHSFHMETIQEAFRSTAKHLKSRPRLSQIPMFSTVTGDVMPGKQLDVEYWWNNIRCPVQFNSAVKHLLSDDYRLIIEISSQPILAHYVKQITLQENIPDNKKPVLLATLPRKRVPITEQHKFFFQNTVCKLYTQGLSLKWKRIQGSQEGKFVRLPTYPWQMKEYWYNEDTSSQRINQLEEDDTSSDAIHPFLEEVRATKQFSGLRCWETEIDLHRFKTLKDHALIQGSVVMPGTAYLEMALAMARDKFICQAMELKNVKLLNLLTLPEAQVRYLRLRISTGKKADEAKFYISSVQNNRSELLLANGEVVADLLKTDRKQKTVQADNSSYVSLARNIKHLVEHMKEMPLAEFKQLTRSYGFNYGPAFSIIKRIWQCDNQGLCLISVQDEESIVREMNDYVVHPSILDACLQSCFVPLANVESSDKYVVPIGFQSVTFVDYPRFTQLFCHVTMQSDEFGVFNVVLMSPQGKVLLTIKEIRVAELTSLTSPVEFADVSYETEWLEFSLQQSGDQNNSCFIVMKDTAGFGDALVEKLHSIGQADVVSIDLTPSREFDHHTEEIIETAFENLPESKSKAVTVVNLWPAESYKMPNDFSVIDWAQDLSFHSSVLLLQIMLKKQLHQARLFLVTKATQLIPGTSISGAIPVPWGSSAWGFRRTAALEQDNIRVIAVDLSSNEGACEVELLVDELQANSSENELAFRDGVRFVNRIVRTRERTDAADTGIDGNPNCSFSLALHPKTEVFCLKKETPSKISGHEIEVETICTWDSTESVIPLMKNEGCVFLSGRVSAVSEELSHQIYSIGDDVCGVVPNGRVSNRMTGNSRHFFPRPLNMTPEQAASLPACLAIAYLALQKLTGGEPGQRILIHEAYRGPGMAAVLIARALGHTVVATTSEDDDSYPREMLVQMGAEQVVNPSCFYLAKDLGGVAVDAVLFFYAPLPNIMQRSSQLFKQGGKILVACVQGGDLVLSGNKFISYERLDIAETLLKVPGKFEELFNASFQLLKQNALSESLLCLPQRSVDVLEMMNTHISELRFPDHNSPTSCSDSLTTLSFSSLNMEQISRTGTQVLPPGLSGQGLKPNRTYVVVGGMRGYGFEVGRWMAEHGAKTVVLVARSAPSDSKVKEVNELERETGATILMFQADVSCPEQMKALHLKLQTLPSVAGIVHSAMVLRDELIVSLDMGNFRKVMAPKIKGGFLLHQLSLEMDLDFFVVFSSMASLFGNIGQASYAACNAFLDSLAQYRCHVLGLPGLSINWGPIGGVGVMARDANVLKVITLSGLLMLQAKEGIPFMNKVLVEEPARSQICLANIDWPQFVKVNARTMQSTRLEIISNEISTTQDQSSSAQSLAEKILLETDDERRYEMAVEYVRRTMAFLVGMESMSETDLSTSLYSYGIDSTGALTLKMQLESNLQVSFEVFYFMQPETTPLRIVRDIAEKLKNLSNDAATTLVPAKHLENISPTPSGAESIHGESQTLTEKPSSSATSQVVPLYTPEGSIFKLFCVHPFHRYALNLAAFASGFRFQTTVSFHALGFTEPTVTEDWESVRSLAYEHVKLIKEEQRHGPYFLAGYSYGGVLAYEMASILTEQEEVVEFVAMIDTFSKLPPSQSVQERMVNTWSEQANLNHGLAQVRFGEYLRKLAVEKLEMRTEDYEALRQRNDHPGIIQHLEERSRTLNVPIYDLEAMYQSLLHDWQIAQRTFRSWEPALVRYKGTLTYLKSTSKTSLIELNGPTKIYADKAWSEIVNGNINVYLCPGDHFSMSEMPLAQTVGGILATAVNFRYQAASPQLLDKPRLFKHRRALQKFQSGVQLFLHSKKGRREPHVGELVLQEETQQLVFKVKGKMLKNISLTDVQIVLPGRFVQNALKYARKKRKVGARHSGNLNFVASVGTARRTYNMEFLELSDLKDFCSVVEAVFGVQIGVA